MDLHSNASSPPVRDAERHSYNVSDPVAGSDAWLAERKREEAALEELEAQITELWGNINAATAYFLVLLAEFDRREGWAQHGVANCAHWLSWQCGIGAVAAREKVRTARALESLPKIAETSEPLAARPMHGDVSAETVRQFPERCACVTAVNAERGLNIDAQTARCKWSGERMDYNIAIDGLCWKAGYT